MSGKATDPASDNRDRESHFPVCASRSIMARMEPTLTILGVYRPQISPETWKEQWQVSADDQQTHEHFASLVLIEGVVEHLIEPFDLGSFGQTSLDFPDDPRRFQCGYDEGLLSADGETLIDRGMNCIHGSGALRFAVYLHQYDPDRPLQWQHGQVTCPPVEDAPVRLMMLIPYTACS